MRVIVSRQMNNWKLPHVNLSLNMGAIPLWQHAFFTKVTDRTLWSIKCNRSAVFLKIHLCENKRNALQLEFYPFSPMFSSEQQKEERWKETDTYTASTRYWLRDVTYHSLYTYRNWRSNKSKIEFQDMWGSKHSLGDPNYWFNLCERCKFQRHRNNNMNWQTQYSFYFDFGQLDKRTHFPRQS